MSEPRGRVQRGRIVCVRVLLWVLGPEQSTDLLDSCRVAILAPRDQTGVCCDGKSGAICWVPRIVLFPPRGLFLRASISSLNWAWLLYSWGASPRPTFNMSASRNVPGYGQKRAYRC